MGHARAPSRPWPTRVPWRVELRNAREMVPNDVAVVVHPDLVAQVAREVDVLLLVLERELRAEGVGDHVGALALMWRARG